MARRSRSGRVWLLWLASGASVLLMAIAIGLTMSTVAQGATISKVASETIVHPDDTVTYTITVGATIDGQVTVTDTLPYGVTYAGNLSPPAASYSSGVVSWSEPMTTGETVVISFDVLIVQPGTEGPLPIINTACANDGVEVCASVTIRSSRFRIFMPLIMKNFVPGPIWPWSIE